MTEMYSVEQCHRTEVLRLQFIAYLGEHEDWVLRYWEWLAARNIPTHRNWRACEEVFDPGNIQAFIDSRTLVRNAHSIIPIKRISEPGRIASGGSVTRCKPRPSTALREFLLLWIIAFGSLAFVMIAAPLIHHGLFAIFNWITRKDVTP